MTRNNDRKPVGSACLPYGTRGGMQLRSDIAITKGGAAGDILNGTPYPALMNSAANVQGQIKYKLRISQIRLQLIADFLGKAVRGASKGVSAADTLYRSPSLPRCEDRVQQMGQQALPGSFFYTLLSKIISHLLICKKQVFQ